MKTFPLALAAFVLAALARGQEVNLKDFLGPDRAFRDPEYGIAFTIPAGWTVTGGRRWGVENSENTFLLAPPAPSAVHPSLYFRRYIASFTRPKDDEFEAHFRDAAHRKEVSRAGLPDYKNDPGSFVFKKINGQPSFNYLATFTSGGQVMGEYFLRIAGQKTYAMFFVAGPLEELIRLRDDIDRLAEAIKVP